ncbi:hypothetical protein [Thermorudis peleae]|uniref:hypothetical protein n=1 Tax=Thermorudis peleae TaxID=1382356 RepID=UPI001E62A8B5|nr:hypothetical protein [Thermorudis peleae]
MPIPFQQQRGARACRIVADPAVQRHADAMAARLRRGMNQILVRRGIPGFVWGESSVFHIVLGTRCANQHGEDIRIPEGVAPEVLKAGLSGRLGHLLHLAMVNEGVDLFHGGGLVSAVHTEAEIDATIEAFDRALQRMDEEGLFASLDSK